MRSFLIAFSLLVFIASNLKSQDAQSIVNDINQQKSNSSITYGSSSLFNNSMIDEVNAVAISETKFVVAYRYYSNYVNPEYYGYAKVGEISGTTITWGSTVAFNLAQTQAISIDAISEDKIVIAYEDIGNSMFGTARIASVSGSSITLGDEYVFEESQTGGTSVKFISNAQFVVAYNNGSNNAVSCVGTIGEDSSISFGASDMFNSFSAGYTKLVVLSSNKVVVAYRYSKGYAKVGTVSGSNISWGTAYLFNNATTYHIAATKLTDSRFVVAYHDSGNSGKGTAIVGEVSGSTISYSSENVFNLKSTSEISVINFDEYNFIITYYEYDGSVKGNSVIGNYDGSTFSWGSEYTYATGSSQINSTSVFKNTNSKIGLCYFQNQIGYAVIGDIGGSAKTWTGASNADWNNANNWSPSGVPTIFDNVVIESTANQPEIGSTDDASCNILTVNENAILMIESTASGTGSLITNNSVNNNGAIHIQRYISNDDWHLLSSPITSATASNFTGQSLQYFDEPSGSYVFITDENTPLVPMKGYSLWSNSSKASTFTFIGTPNNGNQSINLTYTNNGTNFKGANLVGNPYPSYIDWNELDDIWGTIYYWDGEADDFVEWNNGLGSGTKYIPPMQAFFVITGSNGTFQLSNENRAHSGDDNYYKYQGTSAICLYTQNDKSKDELYIQFNEHSDAGFDERLDGYKILSNKDGISQLYSIYEENLYSIDVRPVTNIIQLGFNNNQNGTYQIGSKEYEKTNLILEDTKLNYFHHLSSGDYRFDWSLTDNVKRFKLHMTTTGIDENADLGQLHIYYNNQKIYISETQEMEDGFIHVYNMGGQCVKRASLDGSALQHIDVKLASGPYIVKYKSNKRSLTQKIIVQ